MSKSKTAFALSLLFLLVSGVSMAQGRPNWTDDQLMEPSDLATTLKSNRNLPLIFSVGPGAIIPKSKEIGMAREPENLKKLKAELSTLPKNTPIVIYCGCCPFDRCPNVRPAIQLLKDMNFTNYSLLNLAHNIKIDWIDKGYPTSN